MTAQFDNLTWDDLRGRRSAKWRKHPADILPGWVAEMDFPIADPIKQALHAAIDRDDAGYCWSEARSR